MAAVRNGSDANSAVRAEGKEERILQEKQALMSYIKDHSVEEAVQDVLQKLMAAKPDDPRAWLLEALDKELTAENEALSELELHKLFAVTKKITSEIVPQDTIDMVIQETLNLVHCDTVSLFVLDKKSGMLRLHASNLSNPIMVSPGQGIAGFVFNEREALNIPDCYLNKRFDPSFDKKTGYITRSLLAVPIVDYDESSVGVLQAINKLPPECSRTKLQEQDIRAGTKAIPFGRNDEKILMHLSQHVGIALRNADVYREAIATSERATGLLNTIQSLSQDLGIQSLLLTITMHANKIVSAQRSTVFLVDEAANQLWSVSTDTGQEIRIPKTAGIAGQCFVKEELINIPDAYQDPRFNQEVDKKTGFKTHSILAIPMIDASSMHMRSVSGNLDDKSHRAIGVIQMINKTSFDGQLEAFDDSDIEVMELFAKFVAPQLSNSSMLHRKKEDDSKEAELALGNVMAQSLETPDTRAKKRKSFMGTLGEFNEVEEQELQEEEEEEEEDEQ
mmetsp:Transcript_11187/g.25660  ORF Transcript_11187/g.25660 Transcript_11187/m.25660 type:complete len:505 (+) Transcript_11187:167-1681(+)|eukprot:CAMPEP_0178428078 /NCGR_PEP_ID=MMETSP0689_2-20121128/30084_1 /TAXON_ID=160604 /ORGANISM="Amphidinium massartii, Strain CS-259" /LENGTH=504 /DNA_ID=CAMNT_0020049823 /DNA_START=80 /DNA_END=1594 /DNA_ORIENTATION=-